MEINNNFEKEKPKKNLVLCFPDGFIDINLIRNYLSKYCNRDSDTERIIKLLKQLTEYGFLISYLEGMELKEFQKMLENQKVKSQFPGFGEKTWKHIQYILKSYGHLYEDDRSNTDDNTK